MEQRLGVSAARERLADILDNVRFRGESYIVERHGKAAAAIVPIEVYERWKKEREDLFALVRSVQQANADADPDQVMVDVLEAQASARRSAESAQH